MSATGTIEPKGWWQDSAAMRDTSPWLSRLRDSRSRVELIAGVLEHLPTSFDARGCSLVLWDSGGEPSCESFGLPSSFWPEWLHQWRQDDRVVKTVFATQTATHNLLIYSESDWNSTRFCRYFAAKFGIYHYMSAPLHGPAGTLTGLLNLYRADDDRRFDENDLTAVRVRAAYLSAALARLERDSSATPSDLAPREIQVAKLAAKGMDNAQISEKLGIARDTVKKTLGRVYEKLHVNGRAQMAAQLVRKGVLR